MVSLSGHHGTQATEGKDVHKSLQLMHVFTPVLVKVHGFLSESLLAYVQVLGEHIKYPLLLLI